MNNRKKSLVRLVDNGLHSALKELNVYREKGFPSLRPERIHYSKQYNLITIEISRNRLKNVTEEYFNEPTPQYILQQRTNCRNVHVLDQGKKFIFYFWLSPANKITPAQYKDETFASQIYETQT